MASEKISPEEKLFRMIRSPEQFSPKKEPRRGRFPWEQVKAAGADLFSKWKPLLAGDPKDIAVAAASRRTFSADSLDLSMNLLNRVLAVVLAVVLMMALHSLIWRKNPLKEAAKVLLGAGASDAYKPAEAPAPVSIFLEQEKKRDLFRPYASSGALAAVSSQEALKGLGIVGIYQGKSQEAIVEDKTAKKTYYLKVGDDLRGMKVTKIQNDRVTLQFGDLEVELV